VSRPLKSRRPEFDSWTAEGNRKSDADLTRLAAEVLPRLDAEMRSAVLALRGSGSGWRDAIPQRTDYRVEFRLCSLGIVSVGSRSGDNAVPFQPLGTVVRDMLEAQGVD
jgi:hypothetical protein